MMRVDFYCGISSEIWFWVERIKYFAHVQLALVKKVWGGQCYMGTPKCQELEGSLLSEKLILCCILYLLWISKSLVMDFASGYCFLQGSVESKNHV